MEKYAIKLPKSLQFTDDEFYDFCQENRDLRFERNAHGEIIIMSPTGGLTGKRNGKLSAKLDYWNEEAGLGEVFNSSTGFLLPNGAMRSPDAAWVATSRWEALSYEEQEKFPPLCPDFVVELVSPSDTLKTSQEKMVEWMDNGCQMGWLIYPKEEKVWAYYDNKVEEFIGFDQVLLGQTVLPGFTFDLAWLR
ncbi:Uma2 family endonuclease [Tunicatimonas pelagia]|uniref:Uma2 family endonuclease n=1 Tax=Tunicatimonas pelagia TaxID=931531 RepID=UPI00266517BD|nr:Uma2 family endonuclease [Tunicatimonas pelagia]WKN44111.1 Uma2 family endonuclease [Tunicatimonas pelagia]